MRGRATRLALIASVCLWAEPVAAQQEGASPTPTPMAAGSPPKTDAAMVAAVDAIARRYALAGEVLIARGDKVLLHRGYGTIRPDGGAPHRVGQRWRLASITKQVTAALLVRKYADVGLSMDGPIPEADRKYLSGMTMRRLLQHHSGLANPDDTPADSSGVPSFYRSARPDLDYCVSKPATPNAAFSYNNCDYWIAAGMVGFDIRPPVGLKFAQAGERGVPGFVKGKAEPTFELAAWGPAGGMIGTARAVFDFDRSLMTGKLLPPAALAELWKPEGSGSYQALGQWVFPGRLAGCAAPKRIVQRDGEIYGVQARNFILPDDGLVVIVFTNRSTEDFTIGDVWQGKGFAYDLLSAAVAC